MNTARFVRNLNSFTGDAALYRMDPPLSYENYNCETDEYEPALAEWVVVSAAIAPCLGPETFLFHSNEEGDIVHWGELPGSLRGTLCHVEALANAGYVKGE